VLVGREVVRVPVEAVLEAVVPALPADLEAFAATRPDVAVVGPHDPVDERDLAERAQRVRLGRRRIARRRLLRARRGGEEAEEERGDEEALHGRTASPAVASTSVWLPVCIEYSSRIRVAPGPANSEI